MKVNNLNESLVSLHVHSEALLEGDRVPEGRHPLLRGVLVLGAEEERGGPGVGQLETLVARNAVKRFSILLQI